MKSETPPKLVVLNLPDRDLEGAELKTVLGAIADGINKLGDHVELLHSQNDQFKTEIGSWAGWLRLVAGTIIVTVGVTFIGIVMPLGFALCRQTF